MKEKKYRYVYDKKTGSAQILRVGYHLSDCTLGLTGSEVMTRYFARILVKALNEGAGK